MGVRGTLFLPLFESRLPELSGRRGTFRGPNPPPTPPPPVGGRTDRERTWDPESPLSRRTVTVPVPTLPSREVSVRKTHPSVVVNEWSIRREARNPLRGSGRWVFVARPVGADGSDRREEGRGRGDRDHGPFTRLGSPPGSFLRPPVSHPGSESRPLLTGLLYHFESLRPVSGRLTRRTGFSVLVA